MQEHLDTPEYGAAVRWLVSEWVDAGVPERADAIVGEFALRAPSSPDLPHRWYELADGYERVGRNAEAARYFERASRGFAGGFNLALARYRLGRALLAIGDHAGALVEFSAVLDASQPRGLQWVDVAQSSLALQQFAAWGAASAHGAARLAAGTWSSHASWQEVERLAGRIDPKWPFEAMLRRFAAEGRPAWALEGYKLLLARFPRAAGVCRWRVRRAALVARVRSRGEAMDEFAQLFSDPRDSPRDDNCEIDAWGIVFETVARWHSEALASPTLDVARLRDALRLYDFAEATVARNGEARLWALSAGEFAFHRAEALFALGEECEAAYREAASILRDTDLAREALVKAEACHARTLSAGSVQPVPPSPTHEIAPSG